MPRELLSDANKDEEVELGKRYFLPVEEREQCEPGPNSLTEFDMRQFVSQCCFFILSLSLPVTLLNTILILSCSSHFILLYFRRRPTATTVS